ncbi:UNVERIFIED_CONTAM: hypothetical protein GTU68_053942 [Idotea baltica]|nr:hypothetical protein [Idotea baltica]
MTEEMERDSKVFLVGEEVGSYNGAYKSAKTRLMSAGQINVPIVFRGAGGAAYQLGAQHANSLENVYSNIPGLIVIAPSTPYDMKGLLKSAIRDENPVVFFESELTYSVRGEVPEEEYLIPIGKEGISAEVIDLRTLRPLDEEAIFNSVRKTNKAVVIQEQHQMGSYGSYLCQLITTNLFDELDAPVGLVSSLEAPMPYSKSLETAILPSVDRCVEEVHKTIAGCL